MKRCMGCMEKYEEGIRICPLCGYDEDTEPAEIYHMVPGTIIRGKYIIGKVLGYGGFGVTYIGYDAELERKIAVKEYLPGEFSTRIPGQTRLTVFDGEKAEQYHSGMEKFLDEARRLAKFQDVNGIVHIYDSFFENETAYIVMEYIDGETVKNKLEREGKLSLEDALEIILPITSAMKQVHKAGIIHRDIAPDNIMISKDGKISLIDFGAARFETTTHSKSLSVLIKQGYAPMEQYQSRGEQGPWTDVYALAATLYTMLTGVVPVDSMERQAGKELLPLAKAGAHISKDMETAILNALNLKARERTQSMEQFESELLSTSAVARLKERKVKKELGKWPIWSKVAIGIVTAVVLLFAVLLGTGIIKFEGEDYNQSVMAEGEVMVPNLINTTLETAQVKTEEKNLKIQIVDKQFSQEISEDLVLTQNIEGGSVVKETTVLDLVVSAGVETVLVPSVEGLAKEKAIGLLEERGLTYRIEEVESMVAVGAVTQQSVAPETEVIKGSEVILQVSKGMEGLDDTKEVEMPDITNMDYAEAQEILADLGLHIVKETEVYDDSIEKGRITYQSVSNGTTLHQGDTVQVWVSLGKQMIRVPDVQYKSEKEAKSLLEAEGLVADVVYEFSDIVQKGNVISQAIKAKELVEPGTKVRIVVSKGAEEVATPVVKNWSAWGDSLPNGVSADKYEIETKLQYSYRDKSTIASQDASLTSQGWTLDKTDQSYSQWGSWSDWSETAVSQTELVNVESKTQYRSKTKSTTTASTASLDGWTYDGRTESAGEWSGWTRTPLYASETETNRVEVESRTGTESVYSHTEYEYYNYQYKNSGKTYYTWSRSGAENYCDSAGYTRNTMRLTTYIETYATSQGGYWQGGKEWWYDSGLSGNPFDIYVDQQYIEYRNRTVTYTYHFHQWSDWGAWGDQAITANDNTEVATRTLYRSQQRSEVYTYTYSKWGDWTAYSDSAISSNSAREVRTKTMYRYKEK